MGSGHRRVGRRKRAADEAAKTQSSGTKKPPLGAVSALAFLARGILDNSEFMRNLFPMQVLFLSGQFLLPFCFYVCVVRDAVLHKTQPSADTAGINDVP